MFSKTAQYALRAVAAIARVTDDRSVLAREIANQGKIPDKYLSKILRDLVRAGVLTSTRGIGGGFRLCGRPASVKLIDIVQPFDDVLEMRSCLFGNAKCSDRNPCPVHELWKPVIKNLRTFLEPTSVADIIAK